MTDAKQQNPELQRFFVLCVDILGFARLVIEDEELHEKIGPTSPIRIKGPLELLFDRFHEAITEVNRVMHSPPVRIMFSDSAWFVMSELLYAHTFASYLMNELIATDVPARMGLGYGTFVSRLLKTEISGESAVHSSEFFGTGVVYAHYAESCGVPGMRIFLHPSVVAATQLPGPGSDLWPTKAPSRPWKLRLPTPAPKYAVVDEMSYRSFADPKGTPLEQDVRRMMERNPVDKRSYYEETLKALARMEASDPPPSLDFP
jgi:hypothetical protein